MMSDLETIIASATHKMYFDMVLNRKLILSYMQIGTLGQSSPGNTNVPCKYTCIIMIDIILESFYDL